MIKLIQANFNKEDGVSYVKISTDYGNFEGLAFLHPDDAELASTYLGCDIAEHRALISYFKHRKTIVNRELQVLYKVNKQLKNDKFFGLFNKRAVRIINNTIQEKEKDKGFCQVQISMLNHDIKKKIEDRLAFLEKINNKTKDSK